MKDKPRDGKVPDSPSGQRQRGTGARVVNKRTKKNVFVRAKRRLSLLFLKLGKLFSNKRAGKRLVAIIGICAVLIGLISVGVFAMTYKNAYSVEVDGTQVCIIKKDKADITKELEEQAIIKVENEIGTNIMINETTTFVPIHASNKEWITPDDAIHKLAASYTYKVKGFPIVVEGTTMAILKSQKEVERVVDALKEPYIQEGFTFSGFVEEVDTSTAVYVEADELTTVDKALQILTKTSESAQTYTAVSGDSLYAIALAANMTLEDLLSINPNYKDKTLGIGDEILLMVEKPMISVKTVKEDSHIEVQPKSVQTQENPNQPSSYRKSIQYGSDGQVEVFTQTIRINGIEIETIVVDKVITVPPVAEIVEVGTGP